ncbi:hypothetical protein L1987_53994 [Smallanthus sonchifolius]|uniref:Uncharacterized protein n=1 Tax=Smallanthus sonchifolius TaxID=185202 RepID=A0ACB9E5U0_9ASTR|nr:hypothetical protein L1987_53994 [Smallanthus sonchifolius]
MKEESLSLESLTGMRSRIYYASHIEIANNLFHLLMPHSISQIPEFMKCFPSIGYIEYNKLNCVGVYNEDVIVDAKFKDEMIDLGPIEDVDDKGGHDNDEAAHDEGGHDEVAHDEVGHDEVAHDEAGHDEVAHDEAGHDEGGHDEAGQDEGGHDEGGDAYEGGYDNDDAGGDDNDDEDGDDNDNEDRYDNDEAGDDDKDEDDNDEDDSDYLVDTDNMIDDVAVDMEEASYQL